MKMMLLLKIVLSLQPIVVAAFVLSPSNDNRLARRGITTTRTFALCRPAWLRRFSRIKQKSEENRKVYDSFKKRQKQLGVGKRYRCCNPKSLLQEQEQELLNVYLNIPENEYEAKDPTNIFHRLKHGEVVQAVSPQDGIWIEHDGGGWSAKTIDGMARLEPMDNDNLSNWE
mmetsp:Transcript_23022/g.33980  ORF Transcript_23022/g.33980 Transcript_23022/m.33980 type:complete len:171 (-) Transcript_23022:82-594(-)